MSTAITRTRFVLWREVLFAYLAPALCAGAGGLITGSGELMFAAVTSIAGTSAVVALGLGLLLRHGVIRPWRPTAFTQTAQSALFGIAAAALGGVLAQLLTTVPACPERLRVDIPIAAALAATIVTWRWCSTHRRENR